MVGRYLKLYRAYFRMFILKSVAYRGDFLIGLVSIFIKQLFLILSIKFMFSSVNNINGWNQKDFYFMYAISAIGYGICNTFFDGLWLVGPQYIRTGAFDRLLLRPFSTLFQVLAERINIQGLANIGLGLFILIKEKFYFMYGNIILHILVLLILCLCSSLIISGLLLIFSATSFYIVDSIYLMTLVDGFSSFGRYPKSFYPKQLSFLLTFILPYLFTSFYPAMYFIQGGESNNMWIFTPLVAICVWLLGILLWSMGLNAYQSSGS